MSIDARLTIRTLPEPAIFTSLKGLQEIFTYLRVKHTKRMTTKSYPYQNDDSFHNLET